MVQRLSLATCLACVALSAIPSARAQQEVDPIPPPVENEAPAWLPAYHLDIDMPGLTGLMHVRQSITWTNPCERPTDEILLHVYPRHTPDRKQLSVYNRTMESFRINPRVAVDNQGRRIRIGSIRGQGQDLSHYWDTAADTVLHVQLAEPLLAGHSVQLDLEFDLDIQEIHYRLGSWKGVTTLLNWYPIVAYYGPEGWIAPPFVGWHQPFLNEAGDYDVTVHLPGGPQVVTSGELVAKTTDDEGRQTLTYSARGQRDFALAVSSRHEIHEVEAEGVKISVHAFPEHRFYAKFALQVAQECIERYTRLIGPYPHPEFKIVESYFGWNGNETSGMVLIDQRVFDAPHLGHIYVDHLVSHEILHQWWYNTVGTDGYHETWMDEAVVSHLTEMRIHEKYGDKIKLLDLPKGLRWLPNIDYDTFMHNGYYLYRARGGKGNVLAPLPEIGNVYNLFFLAYDRGGRVVSMIHQRLGDERFYEFLSHVYANYQFRILFVADFQRELEQFTGESWQAFFDDWLRSPKVCDWKVGDVDVQRVEQRYLTSIQIRQLGQIREPVEIGVTTDDSASPILVKLIPDAGSYACDDAQVERIAEDEWKITIQTQSKPRQVETDPRYQLADANLFNNRWKAEPKIRLTPLYTPLEEVAMVRPLDRPSWTMGPSVDAEGRVGFRGSLMEPNRYRVSPYIAYPFTPNDSVFAAGVDGEIYHFPIPNVSLGGRYERTLSTDLFDLPNDQGEVYLRWNQIYTSSFFYPNLAYLDGYFRFGDNFFPDENFRPPDNPAAEIYRDIRAFGIRYHLDSRMPYWNPEQGFALDAAVENGLHLGNVGESYIRGFGQLSFVQKFPEGLGYLSETKIATRLRGGVGAPDRGEHFHFGGPLSFRGQRSEDTEGSAYWLSGADWRFPVWREIEYAVADHVAALNNIDAALIYDVGESFILGGSQGVDHALGVGLYFDVGLFSFVDRITLRAEYAYSLRYDSDILWFGIYHAY